MANGKTPYDKDYKSPYKNNTLRGMIGNAVDYVGGVISHDIDQMKKEAQMMKDYDKATIKDAISQRNESWRQIGEDAKAGYNFVVGQAQDNTETTAPTSQGQKTAPTGPLANDKSYGRKEGTQNILPNWTDERIQEEVAKNKENNTYDVSNAMPGAPTTNPAPTNNSPTVGNSTGPQQTNPTAPTVNQNGTTGANPTTSSTQTEWKSDAKDVNTAPEFQGPDTNGSGVQYGRANGNNRGKTQTLDDPYSVVDFDVLTRQANYQSLQAMDSYDIALAKAGGSSLYGETAMRDLSINDPAKYQEVQKWLKWIQTGDTVNSIASGETVSATSQIDKSTQAVNDSVNKWVNANSTERSHDDVQALLTGKLNNSQTAQTATQEMLNIQRNIADLEEKIANLPNDAKRAFKGDVPQYIVDAFVANNGQRYQSEINKLQSRYNTALDLYKTELSNKQWEAEMEMKKNEYNFKVGQQNWENNFKLRQQQWTETYQSQSLLLNNIKTDKNGKPYIINSDGTYRYLDDATYSRAVQQQVQNGVESLNSTFYDGMDGGQCEEFTDTWNNSVYGQTMVPVDENGNPIQGRTATTAEEKVQYVNSAVPKVGETAIFQYPDSANVSNAAKKWGHTMIVIGYDPSTQMITLKGSNRTGDEKVYTTQMSLTDFRTKYYGAGFWDPSKPTWFQKEQQGAVDTTTSLTVMTNRFESLIENASTQQTRDLLATAQTMYETLSDLKNDGSLEELINTTDFQKVLKKWAEKSYKTDDGGSEFGQLLRTYMYNKNLSTGAKKALNRLYLLVEMKLRNESGAAISSSEWMNNFQNMIPSTFQDKQQMRDVLSNWDIVVKRYSRGGGMKTVDYIPIFDEARGQREIF